MAKKKKQISKKTCSDCVHEFACQTWNVGNIHNMDAERCSNHETVKESPAYLVGLIDGRAEKKTNADRIRGMSDEELAKEFVLAGEFENRVCFCCKYFKCLQNKDGYCVYKHGRCNMDARLEAYKKWLQQPAEED